MNSTSSSPLERLKRPGEREIWERFVELFAPLIFCRARRVGLKEPDAEDLAQFFATLLEIRLLLAAFGSIGVINLGHIDVSQRLHVSRLTICETCCASNCSNPCCCSAL